MSRTDEMAVAFSLVNDADSAEAFSPDDFLVTHSNIVFTPSELKAVYSNSVTLAKLTKLRDQKITLTSHAVLIIKHGSRSVIKKDDFTAKRLLFLCGMKAITLGVEVKNNFAEYMNIKDKATRLYKIANIASDFFFSSFPAETAVIAAYRKKYAGEMRITDTESTLYRQKHGTQTAAQWIVGHHTEIAAAVGAEKVQVTSSKMNRITNLSDALESLGF